MDALSFVTPSSASYGLATLAFAAFAIHLGLGRRGGAKATLLLAAVAVNAVWAAINLTYSLSGQPELWTAQAYTDALRMGAWLAFAVVLLQGRPAWWLAGFALVPFTLWLRPQLGFGLMLVLAVAGLVAMEQLFRRARENVRWAVKPLCIGLGGGFVFDLYVYADALLFGRIDPDLWAARGLAQSVVIPFIALATSRNKDWTVDIALSRGMVFHSTAFLACGLYLLAVAGAGYYVRYFSGSWGKAVQAGFIFAALLLLGWLFSSGAMRARLRVFVNKNFFSYRYDYRQEWLRFTGLLAEREADTTPQQRCIQALANLVESPGGTLWMRDDEGNYRQAARWNYPELAQGEERDMAAFLARTGWVIDLREFGKNPARYADLRISSWLQQDRSAWLVIPIVARDELLGYVVLAAPRAPLDVNWEVRDLLKTAARQVGTFLAETRASEGLLEARKFEAFNKMSAFVVHDLKNLVAQLSLLLKNAERHRANPRFQDDMLATVRHVSERMEKLLLQLSAGSRGEESLRPIHLGRLAERVARGKGAEKSVVVDAEGDVHAVGYEQRFERVVGHLVQNAIEATAPGGEVRINVYAERDRAVLQVADTGCGMSEEFVREKLFRPFQTTKAAGMGIGAYETAQVVHEMGGTLKVQSRPGVGTRIEVTLPLQVEHPAREAA